MTKDSVTDRVGAVCTGARPAYDKSCAPSCFDHAGTPVAPAQQEFRQHSRSRAGWSTMPGDLGDAARGHDRGDAPCWCAPAGRCRHRHHQPARNHRAVGTAPPVRPVANAIVWQDRRTAALCDRLKAEADGADPAKDRARARCLLLRHQAENGCSTTCPVPASGRRRVSRPSAPSTPG